MIDSKFKGLALCSMISLLAAGQAMAHTGVRDIAIAGSKSYNAFTITHGCADYNAGTTQQYPAIGQAALFPYGSTAVWREVSATPSTTNGTVIDGSTIVTGVFNLAVSGLAGVSSPFPTTQEIVDSLGNPHGILWKDGAVEPKLTAAVPFLVTPPAITNACISAVLVRVGVINFCDVQKNASNDATGPYAAPKDAFGRPLNNTSPAGGIQQNVTPTSAKFVAIPAGNGDNNRADWWFADLYPSGSANFSDSDILSEGLGLWSAKITVTNPNVAKQYLSDGTTSNPVYAACPGGAPRQVTVEPGSVDFDTYFTAPNLQPFVKTGTVSNF